MIFSDAPQQFCDLFNKYGDTISYYLFGTKGYSTRDPDVVSVLIDDSKYFQKSMRYPWSELQGLGGNGLITSVSDHPDWKLAHSLLVPAFSASAMKLHGQKMVEISEQACEWLDSRIGETLEIAKFSTNVTFQMLAKIGFDYDLNLFDSVGTARHPFVVGMDYCLNQTQLRASTVGISLTIQYTNKLAYLT